MRTLFISFFILYSACGFTQNTVYLTPYLGSTSYLNSFQNSSSHPNEFIEGEVFQFAPIVGLSVGKNVTENLFLTIGVEFSSIGSEIKYEFTSNDGIISGERYSAVGQGKFFLEVRKPLRKFHIKRIGSDRVTQYLKKNPEYKYLSVFSLEFLFGLNYSRSENWNESYDDDLEDMGRNELSYDYAINTIRNWGLGLNSGLVIQFYENSTRKFQLGIMYHQGLLKRLETTWYSRRGQNVYDPFKTFSRGSAWSFFIAYPINLSK
ncbi:MAG: hypothetical protein ACQETL_12975 [Bacteroidota bacterium]